MDQYQSHYRDSKARSLTDRNEKYLGFDRLEAKAYQAVCWFIARQLTLEYPEDFEVNGEIGDFSLKSKNTEELILFTKESDLKTWAQLSLEVQEDLAIWTMTAQDEWLSAISILSPNHWAPEQKLGKSFAQVHGPVAGIESINSRARQMVETMIEKGPFQRFAWGVATDNRLNHHPIAPTTEDPQAWAGRGFDPLNPKLFVRTERQCLIPFPEVSCSLFTIRTYFEDCEIIKADPRARSALISALESMSPESRIYKGLKDSYQDILSWLQTN